MTALGVNVIADLTARRGIIEASRVTLLAMQQAGIDLSFTEHLYDGFPDDQRDSGTEVVLQQRGSPYPISAFFYSLFNFLTLNDEQYAQLADDKYRIAYWVWEFQNLPSSLKAQLGRVDEIWTASEFCRQCFAPMTNKPITVIPHPTIALPEAQAAAAATRDQLGIRGDRYMFLFVFDAAGSTARKNPEALISAFEQAFGRPLDSRSAPILVFKARNIDHQPNYKRQLQAELDRIGGRLISENWTRQQTNALIACSDSYVSLHRSEGFGMTIAEAMAYGKPVIATAYSGNMDYMTPDNSFLVEYALREVSDANEQDQQLFHELYADCWWAEPSVSDAARLLRYVVENQQEAQKRGQQAALDIPRYCSPEVVGAMIRQRLAAIQASL
ncbi:MAG: glycosyltransferase family 4 protein [Anaerolineae bacterium]|nr:glycosyltransferase family 4 protein [Anaerolineae bacterium]